MQKENSVVTNSIIKRDLRSSLAEVGRKEEIVVHGQGTTKDSLTRVDLQMGIKYQRYVIVNVRNIIFPVREAINHVISMIAGMDVNN